MGGRLRRRDIAVVRPDVARKAAFGAAVGNAMEWFDFGIYSYLAVTIGKIFFPRLIRTPSLLLPLPRLLSLFLPVPPVRSSSGVWGMPSAGNPFL